MTSVIPQFRMRVICFFSAVAAGAVRPDKCGDNPLLTGQRGVCVSVCVCGVAVVLSLIPDLPLSRSERTPVDTVQLSQQHLTNGHPSIADNCK